MTRDTDLDYRVYLNDVSADSLGSDAVVAGSSQVNGGHSAALQEVVGILRQSDHDYFLILDSDCFPVLENWLSVLAGQMTRFQKRFAAPVRTENLDRFPHPSAFLMTREAVHDPRINFETGHLAPNLIGDPVGDVGTAMIDLMSDLLPLMRTNVRNVHPVGSAIYHHVFYHHGAGSREYRFRLTHRYQYCSHWWDPANDQSLGDALTRALFADPEGFLMRLMHP